MHVSNRIFRPDDVTETVGVATEILVGRMPRTCFKTVTKRSNAKRTNDQESEQTHLQDP